MNTQDILDKLKALRKHLDWVVQAPERIKPGRNVDLFVLLGKTHQALDQQTKHVDSIKPSYCPGCKDYIPGRLCGYMHDARIVTLDGTTRLNCWEYK